MADAPEVAEIGSAATVAELLAAGRAGEVDRQAWAEAIDPLQPGLLDERLRYRTGEGDFSWLAAAAAVRLGLAGEGWADADLPFGPLWAPLADRETASLSLSFPKERARRFLLEKLCAASTRALLAELAVFRSVNHDRFLSFDPDSDAAFRAFVAEIRADSGGALFEAYPALLRVLAVTLRQWRANVAALSARLAADFPGQTIKDVAFGLSDPHEGGQSVAIISFDGGRRLVYKPKPVETEAWFSRHFRGLETLAKDGYGYVEFAEPADFEEEKELRAYFSAAGELLFQTWLLGASDLHFENIVATRKGPVPIDLETLCCPRPRVPAEADDAANRAQHEFYFDSVVRTMLLPRWEMVEGGGLVEPSGLAGGAQGKSVDAFEWLSLNRDRMRLARVQKTASAGPNLPRLKGKPVAAADFLPELEAGFAAAYRAAMRPEARAALAASLETLAGLPTRFVFRNTKIYRHLLDKSLTAAALASGVSYSMAFEPLWRALSSVDDPRERESFGRCAALEVEALARRDVPIFKTRPRDAFAALEGRRVLEMNEAPIALCRRRLQRLSEDDLARQLRFIRASFHALRAGTGVSVKASSGPAAAADETALRGFVRELSDGILGGAFISQGEEAWWLSLTYNERARNFQYGPVGSRLFDGALGIALFLAAASKVTGDERARRVALATARLVARDAARYGMPRLTRALGLGIATGAASIPYGLRGVGALLGAQDLVDQATAMALELSPAHLAADDKRHADIVSGAAGALLCLNGLGLQSRELEAAFRLGCGELEEALRRGAKPALGFAHGAAGAAAVCAALGWGDLARRLVALSDARFSEEQANWPDFRDFGQGDRPRYVLSWCGGAAGVGLGRLECGRLLKTDSFNRDVERAVRACLRDSEPIDHLCCGEAGVIAFLRRAGRPAEAAARLSALMARRPLRMGFDAGIPLPGLFQGEAGVGWLAAQRLLPELPELSVFAS